VTLGILDRRDSVRGLRRRRPPSGSPLPSAQRPARGSTCWPLHGGHRLLSGPGVPRGHAPAARSATAISMLRDRYPDGKGILRELLEFATNEGFAIDEVATETVRP
jgi:hypothetical protein